MKNNVTTICTTIESFRTWSSDAVYSACVRENWYTCGSSTEYSKMLDFVRDAEPTDSNIYAVARDIVQHSDLDKYCQTYAENIESVMYTLANDTITTSYCIDCDPTESALTI